jgi:signal transduction histidine kinase
VSDVNPAEFSAGERSLTPEPFRNESTDHTHADHGKPEREGLPASYRMRADTATADLGHARADLHYVDELTARRSDRSDRWRAAAGPAAGAAVPDRPDARGARMDHAFAQLAEDLATIGAAAALVGGDASPMARRLNLDLLRSETWRAAWLVRACGLLDRTQRGAVKPRPLAAVLGAVRSGFAPECRLAGVTLRVHASDWNAIVSIDEPAVVAGLSGAIIATLGLLDQSEGAAIEVNAKAVGGELRDIEVRQNDVAVIEGLAQRFFEAGVDRPGGWVAEVGALTARAVAEQHGGTAEFEAADEVGSTVRIRLGGGKAL